MLLSVTRSSILVGCIALVGAFIPLRAEDGLEVIMDKSKFSTIAGRVDYQNPEKRRVVVTVLDIFGENLSPVSTGRRVKYVPVDPGERVTLATVLRNDPSKPSSIQAYIETKRD